MSKAPNENKTAKTTNRFRGTLKKHFLLLSVAATPFIIFGITSIELYLKNKADLDNRLVVLLPFLVLFAITLMVGLLLYRFHKRSKIVKSFLIVYYLLGPFFFFVPLVRQLQTNMLVKGTILAVTLSLITLFIYRKLSIPKLARFLALLVVVLFGVQAVVVLSDINGSTEITNKIEVEGNNQNENLPNIYHIVLDEYQTDMFELTLNKEVENEMGGFVYYPDNTTIFGRTGMSLPSIFTGQSYDYKSPQILYQEPAFNSDKSFLYWLKKAGYNTRAFIHKIYTFDLKLFDEVIEHNNNAEAGIDNQAYTKLFVDLWLHAHAPKTVAQKFASPDFLEQIEAQNALPATTPVLSYRSFTNIIQDKDSLDKDNTYTFAHFILPHFPHVLREDCSYDQDSDSSPLQQSQCATKLVVEFLDTLKSLDRYDNSLIIIQSDHGSKFRVQNGNLVSIGEDLYSEEWSLARSRPLLLIKTPDRSSTAPFSRSGAETSLLDIAPTLTESTGITTDMNFEGYSLINPDTIIPERVRYYHFFDKLGKNELTNQMSRYIYGNGEIKFDKIIPIGE